MRVDGSIIDRLCPARARIRLPGATPNNPTRFLKPELSFILKADRRNGSFASACTLIRRLTREFTVTAWGLPHAVFHPVDPALLEELGSVADRVHGCDPAPETLAGSHVFFYLSDYSTLIGNYTARWQRAMEGVASLQLGFNRNIGGIPQHAWMAPLLRRIYFQDGAMRERWTAAVSAGPLGRVPTTLLPPPVELDRFLALPLARSGLRLVVGRLAGDNRVPPDAEAFYRRLADRLPGAEFRFMPQPEWLADRFRGDSRFVFLDRDAMTPLEFLAACDIFLLTYHPRDPVPGPRSLSEAMAAGCAPVVIDRDGPRERVVHGVSGYRSNDADELAGYVEALAADPARRLQVAAAARERARGFDPGSWVEQIVANALGNGHG